MHLPYFGYGSNLNEEDWNQDKNRTAWNKTIVPIEIAYLLDYAPVYHYHSSTRNGGALDVIQTRGARTPGVLFEIQEGELRTLNRKEGAPNAYHQERVHVQTNNGNIIEALTYIVNDERREGHFVQPTTEYIQVVRNGLVRFGLNPDAQDAASEDENNAALCNYIFVYGTLREGESRASLMDENRIEPWIAGTVQGELRNLGYYPALIQGKGCVYGELHHYKRITDVLKQLDEVEGYERIGNSENLYERILIDVTTDNGIIQAWTYRMSKQIGSKIESGDWKRR
tara:strand:- start:325 stop:1176 length:852 start_codon:yes stop_codon:yes gene_type:complete